MKAATEGSDSVWHPLRIDRRANTPLYQQIANAIRHRIATNEVPAMCRVPSVRAMAKLAEVTPATIARAYQVLQAEGLIETVSGQGTVVVDARDIENEARARTEEALARAVDQAIAPLLAMRFTPDDILEAVKRRLEEPTARSLIVVAAAWPVAEKYVGVLRAALDDRYDIRPVLIRDIEAGRPAAVASVKRADRCVTLLSLHNVVRDLMAPFGVPISLILTQLSLDSLHELETLSKRDGARIGLVVEELYRPSIFATLAQYFSTDRMVVAADLDPRAIEAALADVDVCIHTLGVQELMTSVRLSPVPVLELRFEPRKDSLDRFVRFLVEN